MSQRIDMFDGPENVSAASRAKKVSVQIGGLYRSNDPRERKRIVEAKKITTKNVDGKIKQFVEIMNIDTEMITHVLHDRFGKAFTPVAENTKTVSGDNHQSMNDAKLFSNISHMLRLLNTDILYEQIRILDKKSDLNKREKASLIKLIGLIQTGCYIDAFNSIKRSRALRSLFKFSKQLEDIERCFNDIKKIMER